MVSYSIHVIVEYNQAGSEIICQQIIGPGSYQNTPDSRDTIQEKKSIKDIKVRAEFWKFWH